MRALPSRIEYRRGKPIEDIGKHHAMNHRFGWDLKCNSCQKSYYEHQKNPTWCIYFEKGAAPAKHFRDADKVCFHGHDLTDPENYRIEKRGYKRCRICTRNQYAAKKKKG